MSLLSSGVVIPSYDRHMLLRIVKPFLAQRFLSTKDYVYLSVHNLCSLGLFFLIQI